MTVVVFRSGIPLTPPADYAETPAHQALIAQLSTNSYAEAVAVLEAAPVDSWLAADILTGVSWARRYLNTTARLWALGVASQPLAHRGMVALLRVLNGDRPRVGRKRGSPLTPAEQAQAGVAIAAWRARVDAGWLPDRTERAKALIRVATEHFHSAAHRRALRELLRRPRLRRSNVVLTLASWETGIPVRRIRSSQAVADLVYA